MSGKVKSGRQFNRLLKRSCRRVLLFVAIAVSSLVVTSCVRVARGQSHGAHGKVDFSVSCSQPAQLKFDEAVTLLHHMTYSQARTAFEQAAALDPNCAMAYWGIAMTLFQPLWPSRPGPEALDRGWQAVLKAKALEPPTELERLLITAAEAFFLEPASQDYWLRIKRWEAAAENAYRQLPVDSEAAVFYALAHLATTPSNIISRAHADRAAEILMSVYKRKPDHPGVMHYLIHANDVPGRENELLEVTRKYVTIAPRNPHAIHMPTHIHTRLGDWDAVIAGNLRAAEAALEYPAGAKGEFVWDEFPHAVEYLVYAYLQKGADESAAAQLKRMRDTPRLEPSFKTAFHLSSSQARFALERRDWKMAAALVAREPAALHWDRFTWPEAIVQFARGLGSAHLGKFEETKTAVKRLAELEEATRKLGEDLFVRNIRVLRLELSAWLAHLEQRHEEAVTLMRQAAELELSTPKHAVTPGPTLPAYELLGDLLMENKRPAEALAAYKRSLEHYPKRFNSLLGGARAARLGGDKKLASAFYREFLKVADRGSLRAPFKEAQKYANAQR
jgi:tetratricopeptide (TPR) repeat protein